MIWDWLRRHPVLVDLGFVAVLLLFTVGGAVRSDRSTVAWVLAFAEVLPLLRRRQQPLLVLAVVTSVSLAMIVAGVWQLPFPLAVALYTVAADCGVRVARLAGVASVGVVAAVSGGFEFESMVARVVFLVAAWLAGDSVRSRRTYVREIEQKAERLEREQASEARRAAAEEQARIARELHDVVAHALSVIIVQAGAADDVFELDPQLARTPIRAIDAAARAALDDLRRVLGILHQNAEYEPHPSLDRLDQLIDRVRATGLDVSLRIEGAAIPLPATVDLSAYRIVQEALTNTLKHAHAEHVHVRVRHGAELQIEIRDDGSAGVNGGTSGSGLIGMRERAAMLGGTVETGPAPDGGYVVFARIPVGGPV